MNTKIRDCLLFLLTSLLIFNNISDFFRFKLLFGVVSQQLIVYPLIVGMVYTLYCQHKYKNVFVDYDKFSRFIMLYVGVYTISALWGAYIYPYYDTALNTSVEQIPKLAKIISIFHNIGITIDDKLALKLWIIGKPLKSAFVDTLYTFGGAYMIYCWYYDDWQKAIKIVTKGVLAGLIVIFAYSTIEVLYLAGNTNAQSVLEIVTPYFHPIKTNHGWWPPLLWQGQLRSVFSEPSNMGNYIALAVPVVWYLFLRDGSKRIICLSGVLTFFVFLTNARTAWAMLFGMLVLLPMLLVYGKRLDLLKKTIVIFLSCVVAFGMQMAFANYGKIRSANKMVTAIDSLEENFLSLASSSQRSNNARYGLIKANLRIAADYPILGVGNGLAAAYIPDYYTEEEKQNREISNWIKYQKQKGVFADGASMGTALNEYVTILAQSGILGLGVFMFPFLWVITKLLILCRRRNEKQIDILVILLALISCFVAGCNLSINLFYSI